MKIFLPRSGADVCSFKKEVGPGRAAFPRWFYNKKTSQCEKFRYGGVGGNGNNFESKDECEERCGKFFCWKQSWESIKISSDTISKYKKIYPT